MLYFDILLHITQSNCSMPAQNILLQAAKMLKIFIIMFYLLSDMRKKKETQLQTHKGVQSNKIWS
jgi:hypothetical protein